MGGLSDQRRPRGKSLWWSQIRFHATAAASATPPEFDPNKTIVVHLRCTGGERGAICSLPPKVGPLALSPKEVGDDMPRQLVTRRVKVTMKRTIQNRQAQTESFYLCPDHQNPQGTTQRWKEKHEAQ